MEVQPQILIAAYEDGLLITIDGKSYFLNMTEKRMLELAQDLINKSLDNIRGDKYGLVR